jgi:hypothetical protein
MFTNLFQRLRAIAVALGSFTPLAGAAHVGRAAERLRAHPRGRSIQPEAPPPSDPRSDARRTPTLA